MPFSDIRISTLLTGIGLIACLVFSQGCGDEKKPAGKPPAATPPAKPVIKAPAFNQDSAFAYIEAQLAFGPRVPNTGAHVACANWLVGKMKGFGATVTTQPAMVQGIDLDGNPVQLNMQNIIASYNPEQKRRIMISAHWDTRPYADAGDERPREPIPGANDGASGVAIILEIARQLGQKAPAVGVDLCLWDAEDYGNPDERFAEYHTYCLGSQYWSRNKHKPNYNASYGINLDMVGAANAHFRQDAQSRNFARPVVDKVWATAAELGYGRYFPMQEGRDILDDHIYLNTLANIPYIDIIDQPPSTGKTFFGQWHTHQDDIHVISRETLKAVGQTVLEVIHRE